jgi:hypothetical protein
MEACEAADDQWAAAARRARLDHRDIAVQGLRDLLRRASPNREVFTSIARRYL